MREDRETLVVRCDCHGPHFVQVYIPDDGTDAYAFFSLTTEPTTWRERLRFARRMIFNGAAEYPSEAVLGPKGLDELQAFITERRALVLDDQDEQDPRGAV